MDIVISNTSDKPIYQQIFEQISAQIIRGELKKETCLPPIRTVAKELRISVITVKKAWEELERRGFIHTMVGKGCFVASLLPDELHSKRNELADETLQQQIAVLQIARAFAFGCARAGPAPLRGLTGQDLYFNLNHKGPVRNGLAKAVHSIACRAFALR